MMKTAAQKAAARISGLREWAAHVSLAEYEAEVTRVILEEQNDDVIQRERMESAAPEMFEALEEIRIILSGKMGKDIGGHQINAALRRAEAALNKARGGE